MRTSEGHNRILKFLLCLSALLFAIPFTVLADELSMSVTYGYRNTAKSGQLLPVTVDIDNDSIEEYDGYVVMEILGDDGSNLTYTFPSFVGPGTTSFKYTVTIPDGYSSEDGDRLRVSFTDDSGERMAEKDVDIFYHGSGQDVLCGILSDDRSNLMYLGNVSLGNNLSTKTVTFNPDDIPSDAAGLSQLDIIVISSFDMRLITGEAAETITDWVKNGGTLLFGTGSTVNPLGEFNESFGSVSVSPVLFRKMDMGMQYSTTGPDGALITLPTRRITWDEADETYGFGEVPLMLMRDFGSGRVCIAACDLCDLSEFGLRHPEFTEDFLNTVVGTGGLVRIKSQSSSAEERLVTSEKLTNTYKTGEVPSLLKYVVASALYIILAGVILYLILKEKGLGVYYPLGVLILSMFFGLSIWFMSSDTRVKKAYVEYGTFIMHPGSSENENTEAVVSDYIRIGSPEKTAFTLPVSAEAAVKPVMVNGNLSVSGGKKKIVALTGQKQFEESILLVEERKGVEDLPVTLRCDIRKGGTAFEGTVTNLSECDWSSVFILTGGCVVKLSDIKRGQSVDVSQFEPVYGPLSLARKTADYLSGETKGQKHDLIKKAVSETAAILNDDIYVMAFADSYVPSWLSETNYDLKGLALFAVSENVQNDSEGYVNTLFNGTSDSSGSYDEITNTISGSATTVVTYSLGNGRTIESLKLVPLSTELSDEKLVPFSGQIAVYNYINGSYELVNGGKTGWDGEELSSVLSPTNNITLRFIPDGELSDDTLMYLPVPYAKSTGRVENTASAFGPGM